MDYTSGPTLFALSCAAMCSLCVCVGFPSPSPSLSLLVLWSLCTCVCMSVHVDCVCVCVLKLGGWKMVGERGRVKRHSMYIEERERARVWVYTACYFTGRNSFRSKLNPPSHAIYILIYSMPPRLETLRLQSWSRRSS